MTRIGIISDTHGKIDINIEKFLSECDLVIHAGDIGNIELADVMEQKFNFKAVYGNIDNHIIRSTYKKEEFLNIEGMKILVTHIGGYPKRYESSFKDLIIGTKPDIVICGHSHILKVMYDSELKHLHINPGACGSHGFHKARTAVRFKIDKTQIFDLEVGEWGRV